MAKHASLLALGLGSLLLLPQARATTYNFEIIPSSIEFGHPDPFAISNSGVVVGNDDHCAADGTSCALSGFAFDHGQFIDLHYPGAGTSVARGINSAGVIVVGADGDSFLFDGLTYSPYVVAGGSVTTANTINDAGQIGGQVALYPQPVGFVDDHGLVTLLTIPGSISSRVMGIGKDGTVIGDYVDQNKINHGFIFSNGNYQTINDPLATATPGTYHGTFLAAINAQGVIVGSSTDDVYGPYSSHGFVIENGQFQYLGTPFGPSAFLSGINDSGQIVGMATGGVPFIATPVPAPSSVVLLSSVLAMLGVRRERNPAADS